MRIWIWIAVGIGLVSILSVAGWLANGGVDVEVVRAKQGPIRETISEQGTTRIPDVYEVRMPFSGELAGFELKEGDTISAGATVVQIGPRELENHVQEAQAAVERLTAALAENQNDGLEKTVRKQATRFVESMAATVEAAQTQIESSQEKLDFSETLLGRETQLLERQASNQENVDRARLNYVESQISFRQNNLIVSLPIIDIK